MKIADSRPLPPSILVVDDEAQIHSSLRLRLGRSCRLQSVMSPREALESIAREPHDLCIVDVHMPEMDGLTFIEEARRRDPGLGFVIFSGYDTEENLRRAVPLQVYDFIPKPLPDRERLEKSVPTWVNRTRARRRELSVTSQSETIVRDLELARIERDVESTASESAREALIATATSLSTAQALLLNVHHGLEPVLQHDAKLLPILRSLQEARRQVEAAALVTEGYFTSAFADRASSRAIVDTCARHAIAIASRLSKSEERKQSLEYQPLGRDLALSGVTGIEFLLLFLPALLQAAAVAAPATTIRVHAESVGRLEEIFRPASRANLLWVNRRNSALSSPGVCLHILLHGPAPKEPEAVAWLRGDQVPTLRVPCQGLVQGVQKAKAVLGLATAPNADRFALLIGLPV